ncbi:MAG: hypothetical protein N4A40_09870 [Tissierellales bacterium]|jgi:hypothetical protein|nr:hypothetical protein [Tissierellales bacterium]
MKTERIEIPYSDEVKRFPIPYIFKMKCKNCGEEVNYDFNKFPLEYPNLSGEETIGLYCENCNCEFEIKVKLNTTVQFDFDLENIKKTKY